MFEEVREYIENYNMEVGKTCLMLNGKTRKCVDTTEDSYGTRYVFDDGIAWTKSNIVSNIAKCMQENKEWAIGKECQ